MLEDLQPMACPRPHPPLDGCFPPAHDLKEYMYVCSELNGAVFSGADKEGILLSKHCFLKLLPKLESVLSSGFHSFQGTQRTGTVAKAGHRNEEMANNCDLQWK